MVKQIQPHPINPVLYGSGFFSDAGQWIKKAAGSVYRNVLVPVGKAVKDTKIVSSTLKGLPGNYAKAGAVAEKLGWGRKKMRGGAKKKTIGKKMVL